LSANVKFRLALSATPSPNDQTEYASHAVFLGICNTQKEFYSRFFVKDGTEWRLKPHAKDKFYDFLKSWACYIQSPTSLGFEQGAELMDEPEYIIQESYPKGDYFIEGSFLAQGIDMANNRKIFTDLRCDTTQERFKMACDAIRDKQSIIWCNRNKEEDAFAKELSATKINGSTPLDKRIEIVDAFKKGEIRHIVSKPSVLGFGINIQEAEAHLYSGYNFSLEEFYRAVRRSHRYGRKGRLKVYVPVSEPERPVWDSISRKLKTFKQDVKELQNRFFKN
jgi:superfamily II DNA or RNA helicase